MTIEYALVVRMGLVSTRPAAGNEGAMFFATDTGLMYRDNGSVWVTWTPLGVGATGPQGLMGPMGSEGDEGASGPPGTTGATGAAGAAGAAGATGQQGPIGYGFDGDDGEDGRPGPQGATGATGATGAAGSGGQLDYVEFTTPVSVTGTTEGAANTVVASGSVAYDGATPVLIHFFAPYVNPPAAASGYVALLLYEDATILGWLGIVRQPGTSSANMYVPVNLFRRLTPANASIVYTIKALVSSGTGTVQVGTGGTGVYMAGFIRITNAG